MRRADNQEKRANNAIWIDIILVSNTYILVEIIYIYCSWNYIHFLIDLSRPFPFLSQQQTKQSTIFRLLLQMRKIEHKQKYKRNAVAGRQKKTNFIRTFEKSRKKSAFFCGNYSCESVILEKFCGIYFCNCFLSAEICGI